jgi:hypothetical protein
MPRTLPILLALAFAAASSIAAAEDGRSETRSLVDRIRAVGQQGAGNVDAAAAMEQLSRQPPAMLPEILNAFDGAGPLAANYLRNAVESIADTAIADGKPLPTPELSGFVADVANDPRARSLAYDLLARTDGPTAAKLVPGFLKDPSGELRRIAVAELLQEFKELDPAQQPEQARAVLEQALSGAVDNDQVKQIVGPLKKLGVEVDLPTHFGFLTDWRIVGPFDNRGKIGFAAVYPPERSVDLSATYPTDYDSQYDGETVTWAAVSTDDDYGVVDIGKQLTNWKGSCVYAAATFPSDRARRVQIRLGTPNAWKLWVNGKLAFAREEYRRGSRMDQYRVPVTLQPGPNEILLKICQDEQAPDWAQAYQFQLRITDQSGSAVQPTDAAE